MQKPEQSEPPKSRAQRSKEWREANRERERELSKPAKDRYAASERGKYMKRTAMRAKRYGITREQLLTLMENPCAICGKASEHVDHDHATGKVRGALCGLCNKGLGQFRDSLTLLVKAAAYLKAAA